MERPKKKERKRKIEKDRKRRFVTKVEKKKRVVGRVG